MKKLTAILLAILICLSLGACSTGEDAPDGMQSVTTEGNPFLLYVPSTWTPNTSSGISSAYVTFNDKLIASARYFTPDSDISLDEHIATLADNYAEIYGADFSLLATDASDATVLGGANARSLCYSLKKEGTEYTVTQYFAKYKGDIVSLNFYATGEAMTIFADDIESIKDNFLLCEKKEIVGDSITDKNTPDGMKIASSDKLEYRLYVPSSWICNSESGISEAFYPESEKTNVTVTSYSPSEDMSLEEYFELCRTNYEKDLNKYTLLPTYSEPLDVAGKEAISFSFSAEYEGHSVVVRQVIFFSAQNGLFYNFTYTATPENFPLHIEDFEKMLDSFIFR